MLLRHKYHVHPESGTERRYGQAVCGGQQGVRRAGGEEWQEVSRAGACSPGVKEASVSMVGCLSEGSSLTEFPSVYSEKHLYKSHMEYDGVVCGDGDVVAGR